MNADNTGPRATGVALIGVVLAVTLYHVFMNRAIIFADNRHYMHLIAMLLVAGTTTECILNA